MRKKLIALIMIIVTLLSFGNVDVHAAEHVHKWVWKTHIVHHYAVTKEEAYVKEAWDEQVLVKEAWDEQVIDHYDAKREPHCMDCDAYMPDGANCQNCGCWDAYDKWIQTPVYKTIHHDAEYTTKHHDAEYGTRTVVVSEAYDEVVKDYLYCSECSERNSFPFVDVPDDSNYINAVVWAYESEPRVVEGITANKFKPFNQCSRAQVVSFIWRMKGKPGIEDTGISFSDVHASDFYYEPVLWAAYNGITSGKTADTFAPGDTCTRAQFVTFLWRLEGMPAPHMNNNPFYDLPDNASYRDAVLWAYENDITKGVGTSKFSPEGVINRAQTVMFLHRYYEYLETHTTHTHSWDSGKVTTQPTCTSAGTKTYICTSCGATKTESVVAKGHNWTTKTEKVEVASGYWDEQPVYGYRCDTCGFFTTSNDTIHKHSDDMGHPSFGQGSIMEKVWVDPIYDEVTTTYCTVCGKQK